MTSSNNCHKCGVELVPDAKLCASCGSEVTESTKGNPQPSSQIPYEQSEEFKWFEKSNELILEVRRIHNQLDWARRLLIALIWGPIFLVLLANVHWGWSILWTIGGFLLVLNVVGLLMVPLYRGVTAAKELEKHQQKMPESLTNPLEQA
jgi:Flp pilus assembly protein TadB